MSIEDTLVTGEAARRRTFAIISHPDAGKTTLTENLLLISGAIHQAGAVRARGVRRRTRSDWMAIERERGISVSASVMTFEHGELLFNLLDTPGHEDFSEDTYRTLTAADSAIMVIDAAKGIEPRTLKLFEVCRLRDIPIVTFINKMDREARDTFELIDEIQDKLALDAAPRQWPAGSGERFRGVASMANDDFLLYRRRTADDADDAPASELTSLTANSITTELDEAELELLREEVELARDGYSPFDLQSFREGHMTPIYFGSALRSFGMLELLNGLAEIIPGPQPVTSTDGTIYRPDDDEVAGFVFKVQANMDPQHRDRIAFMKLVSGKFRRGMKLKPANAGKAITIKDVIADAMLQQILTRPAEYSVIATLNLNGDYLSDALAAQVGGIGIAPGGNINYESGHAVFEATHGTAPKYAGQDKVNPGSIILSGEMMLRYMGWTEAADLIIGGMTRAIADRTVTYDFHRLMEKEGAPAKLLKCSEFGDAVIDRMS